MRDGADAPPSGNRYTVYFRTTITPTSNVTAVKFEGIEDDGCIIYLDDAEVGRINMTAAPDTWTLFAAANGNELAEVSTVVTNGINLTAGVPVVLGIALHNVAATSSDIGMDIRAVAQIPPFSHPPANDDFINANTNDFNATLPGTAVGLTDDTVGNLGATKELGEPDHAGDVGGGSVWWSWTPTNTMRVALSAEGTAFDAVVAVYTGAAVGLLTEVASDSGDPAVAVFEAVANTTYHFAVDGKDVPGTGPGFGAVELALTAMAPNDNFADANTLDFVGVPPLTTTGSTQHGLGGISANKEAGEPNHAGNAGGGSVWWSWTATNSYRVAIHTATSNFDTLLGVYTGNSLASLVEVGSSGDASFRPGSYVAFDAVAGTTYHFAVDGNNVTTNGAEFGTISLSLVFAPAILKPISVLLPSESGWKYLLESDGGVTNNAIDPSLGDPDFYDTWHSQDTAVYDGPAFRGPGPALLGYGIIDAAPIVTDVWNGRDANGDGTPDPKPANGLNGAVYFHTSFTPTAEVAHVAFEGLIDDGAVIFLNGTEVGRMNVLSGTVVTNWLFRAEDTRVHNDINDETTAQFAAAYNVNLPANVPAEVGVVVVSNADGSSDLGMNLQVLEIEDTAEFLFDLAITRLPSNRYQLAWESVPGALYDVESSADFGTWNVDLGNVVGGENGVSGAVFTPGTATSNVVFRVHRKL
jgi:hypothetical protein